MTDCRKSSYYLVHSNDVLIIFFVLKNTALLPSIPKYQSKLNTFVSILFYHLDYSEIIVVVCRHDRSIRKNSDTYAFPSLAS